MLGPLLVFRFCRLESQRSLLILHILKKICCIQNYISIIFILKLIKWQWRSN